MGTSREAINVKNEGLTSLLGQKVTFFCANYIYTGVLKSVNGMCVKLSDAAIVYETGAFTDQYWEDAQPLPNDVYIMLGLIESFMILK